MQAKLIGGILLIIGTSIGAGMLGLPIAAAQLGFPGSIIMLVTCWVVMLACAFLILEINLWLPQNNNLISMAKLTIGPIGQVVAWVSYLMLLYSLLCAYIAGGSDLFRNLLLMANIYLPTWLGSLLFTLIFGAIVYAGMSSVDKTNRVLMVAKFVTFFMVIILLIPFIATDRLMHGSLQHMGSMSAITVTTAAFGWATLVPSLRTYFAGDLKKLKIAVVIGSAVPLICYIIWDMVIMGVLPIAGNNSLVTILNSGNSTSNLVDALSTTVASNSVTFFIKVFTSICVSTSFLGVALCLTDFLADGLQLEKKGHNNIAIHLITFVPALTIAIFFPNAFIKALEYAGISGTVLLILLPAWMAWSGRYKRNIPHNSTFIVFGGKRLLFVIILFSCLLIVRGVIG